MSMYSCYGECPFCGCANGCGRADGLQPCSPVYPDCSCQPCPTNPSVPPCTGATGADGGVTPGPAVADVPATATAEDIAMAFNALLASLRAAGVIKS